MDADRAHDLADVLAVIRRRADERVASGVYPSTVVADLDAEFRRIATSADTERELDQAKTTVAAARAMSNFSRARVPMRSRIPGGRAVHRVIGKIVARQVQGTLEQMRTYADSVNAALDAIVAALENPSGHTHADIAGEVDLLVDRLASLDRADNGLVSVAGIASRVDALEAAEARRTFRPWYRPSRYAARFEANASEAVAYYAEVVAALDGSSAVAVLAPETDSVVEAVRAAAPAATVVEGDADPIAWLAAQPDESLDGIVLGPATDHVSPQDLADVVYLSSLKLRRSGRLVGHGADPRSLATHAWSFAVDPRARRPVHPAYVAFLVAEAGFDSVDVATQRPFPIQPDDATEAPPRWRFVATR